MSGTLEALSRWASGLRLEEIPTRVVERARLQLASQVGSFLWGRSSEEADLVVAAASVAGGGPAGSVGVGFLGPMPVDKALFVTTALASGFDFDDYMLPCTTSPGVVWSPLLEGILRDADWEDILRAQVATTEVLARLALGGLSSLARGSALSGLESMSSALGAGLVAGASPEVLARSMRLVLAAGTPAVGSPHRAARMLARATAVQQGYMAARLAAAGMECSREASEQQGHSEVSRVLATGASLDAGLSHVWLADTLSFKRSPVSPLHLSATAAVRRILAAHLEEHGRPLAPSDVLTVEVEASLFTLEQERLHGRAFRVDPARPQLDPRLWTISLRGALAFLIADGGYSPAGLSTSGLAAHCAEASRIAERVEVHQSLAHTAEAAQALGKGIAVQRLLETQAGTLLLGRGALARWRGVLPELLDGAAAPEGTALLAQGLGGLGRALGARLRGYAERGPGQPPGGGLGDILEAAQLEGLELVFPASVRIALRGGQLLTEEVRLAPGAAGSTLEQQRQVVGDKLSEAGSTGAQNPLLLELLEGIPTGGPRQLWEAACAERVP